ncbi:MAG: SpoVG family protein [Planctomycetota bacterium]
MNITEVRIKLTDDPRSKLKAYCSVTFDDEFVVRDLKVIEGARGPFVAMPSRKLSDRCPRCSGKNYLQANYCQNCGVRLAANRAGRDGQGRSRLHADLAHPINAGSRIALHRAVVKAFMEEVDRSKVAGYVPPSFDDLDEIQDRVDDEYLEDLAKRHRERIEAREGNAGEATTSEH